MKKEPIVMAIANQKGGVGKTTTTVNLGIGLAKEGNKVLMIDFDPQGDMTTCLGVKQADEIENTITKLMFDSVKTGKADCQSALMHHEEGVDFIPSNIDLADFEMQMISVFNRESILKNTINEIKKGYDYGKREERAKVFNIKERIEEFLEEIRPICKKYGIDFPASYVDMEFNGSTIRFKEQFVGSFNDMMEAYVNEMIAPLPRE